MTNRKCHNLFSHNIKINYQGKSGFFINFDIKGFPFNILLET